MPAPGPLPQKKALGRAIAEGVVIVAAAHQPSGGIDPVPGAPFIAANDLSPHKARILLTLALSNDPDPKTVRTHFTGPDPMRLPPVEVGELRFRFGPAGPGMSRMR